jgi:hypothetical protein
MVSPCLRAEMKRRRISSRAYADLAGLLGRLPRRRRLRANPPVSYKLVYSQVNLDGIALN